MILKFGDYIKGRSIFSDNTFQGNYCGQSEPGHILIRECTGRLVCVAEHTVKKLTPNRNVKMTKPLPCANGCGRKTVNKSGTSRNGKLRWCVFCNHDRRITEKAWRKSK